MNVEQIAYILALLSVINSILTHAVSTINADERKSGK